jgi:hypothetical protein
MPTSLAGPSGTAAQANGRDAVALAEDLSRLIAWHEQRAAVHQTAIASLHKAHMFAVLVAKACAEESRALPPAAGGEGGDL